MQGSGSSLDGDAAADGERVLGTAELGSSSSGANVGASDDPGRASVPVPMPVRAEGPSSQPGDDRRIGQVVDGKYHVLRRLACGGMGSVYEARHTVVGRHFAIKFLHEHYAQRSCMVQRFLREAQAAGSIASDHIIGVLDYGTTDGTPYLVMELVRGQDLREILADTPQLPARRAVRIVLDACRGLALAHERGLVHRDLKPANICVTRGSDGREVAKVIDFGVAKLRDGAELSEEGTLIGTVGYMAPEQLTDQRQLDARADIYALGVILYQALAGRPPHICNRSELLYRIVSVDPKPLSELCPDLPAGLSEVVHKALCRSKERRYGSVRELARALERFAGDEARTGASDTLEPLVSAPADASDTRAGGLGTAETEIGCAPTWAGLSHATDQKAVRQCEPLASAEPTRALALEQYCRHPEGLPLPPAPVHHHHLSQRALVLSVGALLSSVVAMTTMFVFVYSHGSGALESAARAPARPQTEIAAPGAREPAHEVAREHPTEALSASALAPAESCTPLRPASVSHDRAGVSVQRHALEPAREGGPALPPGRGPAAGIDIDCE